MVGTPSDAALHLFARVVRVGRGLLTGVEAELKAADLPPLVWYDVLLELGRNRQGRLRQSQLGERMLLAKHNLSRLLDRLEERGLLERRPCPEDGRGADVVITAAGRRLRKRMWPVYRRAVEERVSERLSPAESERLLELLGKLQEPHS